MGVLNVFEYCGVMCNVIKKRRKGLTSGKES